jgi:tryptophanyl-tRNA synthetase
MGIKTDSKGVDEPKDPEGNTVYELYKLFATPSETKDLAARFKKGGLGYGDAKKMLLAKIRDTFAEARAKREELMKSPEKVDAILKEGAAKARKVAIETLNKVRKSVGLHI